MARFYHDDPEYSQVTPEEKALRDKIMQILSGFTQEMENYAYYGSNPGIKEDAYDDVAEKIIDELQLK